MKKNFISGGFGTVSDPNILFFFFAGGTGV
jgi:hypothetical protein